MPKEKARIPELEELATQVGSFIRYWGFKKVHGQIWTHLFLSSEPLDAACLMARLGISKALVSMSLHDLLEYHVIVMAEKSSRGTQLYRANADVMEAILHVLRIRERKMLSQIQGGFRSVKKAADAKKNSGLDTARVEQLGSLIDGAEEMLDAFLSFRQIDLSLFEKFSRPEAGAPRAES